MANFTNISPLPTSPLVAAPRLSLPIPADRHPAPRFPATPSLPLRRLLYTSRAVTPEACDAGFFATLAEGSQARNQQHGITGCLVYSAPFFFQVIEGPPDAVTRLFDRILTDPRHTDRVIILDQPCSERLHGRWAMQVSDAQGITLHPTIATVLSRFGASFISMWPYLPGNAATLLVQGKNPICEAPERVRVVSAFIQLVEFPGIVEQPLLNDCLPDILGVFVDACARYICQTGGLIAKFINGTCMAYWPPTAVADAIAAVRHIETRFRVARETEPSWSPFALLHTSAGFHFGTALLCNAGQRKSDFTLLGDSINTTARIAALALQHRRPLLLSGTVAALLRDQTGLRSIGLQTPRGRTGPVECFHYDEPETPLAAIRHAIQTFCPSSSFGQYSTRKPVQHFDDLSDDEAPLLFHEVKAPRSPTSCLTPRTSSVLSRAASWVMRTQVGSEDLTSLTYISTTAAAFSAIDANVTWPRAKQHNQQAGITSCLLIFEGAVVQTLEGPLTTVLPVLRRIKADTRLADTVVVHMQALPQRQFKEPLQVLHIASEMMAHFPSLPDILIQLARSFRCLEAYVPSLVVRHIAAGQDPRLLQPVRVSVAMLAADICCFTALSEGSSLRAVWQLCNTFIESCICAIAANGGEVMKLIGDCVLAFFPTPALPAAVTAADAIVLNCEQVRHRHSGGADFDNRALLYAGVGLDWGSLIVAHCGSLGTADLMVAGEVSSRVIAVEAATRDVGCAVVASSAFTSHLADGSDLFEPLSTLLGGAPLARRRGPEFRLDPALIAQRIRQLRPLLPDLRADSIPDGLATSPSTSSSTADRPPPSDDALSSDFPPAGTGPSSPAPRAQPPTNPRLRRFLRAACLLCAPCCPAKQAAGVQSCAPEGWVPTFSVAP